MSNLPGMVYRSSNDHEWTMESVSQGCYKLTGYTAGELIGNSRISYGQVIHPKNRDMVWTEIQKALGKIVSDLRRQAEVKVLEDNLSW